MHVPTVAKDEQATRNDWYLDMSIAALGLVLVHASFCLVMALFIWDWDSSDSIVTALAGAIIFASICLRQHFPWLFALITGVFIVVQLIFVPLPSVSWMVIPLAVYDVARRHSNAVSTLNIWAWLVIAVIAPFRWLYVEGYRNADTVVLMVLATATAIAFIVTPHSLGRRRHDVHEALVRQRAAEVDAEAVKALEQVAHRKNVEAQVRSSIARELHDIVAHSVAVMVVQAEGGLAQMDKNDDKVRQSLQTVSDTGREALQEMRRIVRMLRAPDIVQPAALDSAPTVSQIPALVSRAQATLSVTGSPHATTPMLETTIYRVVQESLTNAFKHAGSASAPHVVLEWEPTQVTVTVTNQATDVQPMMDNRGTGLVGMAERVQAQDGTLDAGPLESGGFRVCAQLPLRK